MGTDAGSAAGRGARPVVAGVDGSEPSTRSAHYAALLARERQVPLELLCAYENPLCGFGPPTFGAANPVVEEETRQAAEQVLSATAEQLHRQSAEVTIQSHLRAGSAASVLIDASRRAAVTVVGSRGAGGFAGLVLGSVSAQVAAHGHGTVVVVRPPADQPDPAAGLDGPVLVGYDASAPAQAALEFAAQEAALRDTDLVMIHVHWQAPWGAGPEPDVDPAELARQEAEQMLAEAAGPLRERHPGLAVQLRAVHSLNPERALVEQSEGAGLVVVGCRGRGGFTGMLLGSISHALVQHASCPVAVVHDH
ncbi:universal stress protein [Catellatospora chokoriensis]|uniref:Universal stress protein n=1 Tax=Catellatospora chokoriensis TaxID=310353 RepID=A0A8J3KCW1_9ACTN|nr:universal stress protein [Catellatospora chokoriensis]GIF94458.1 universal stress protein [Catellatospora chokoriensis]